MGENLSNLGFHYDILDITPKAHSMKKWINWTKIEGFSFVKHIIK